MALTEIEYGSLASSDVMNKNFEYLDNKIVDVSEDLASNVATINSNIATINSSITTMNENLTKSVEDLNTNLTNSTNNLVSVNGLYITMYSNGTSWYREYFSDAAKTQRVWLEQGGALNGSGDFNWTLTFLRPFSNTNYTILKNSGGGGTGGVAERWMGFWNLTNNSAITGFINHWERWYACGI